MLLHWSLTLLHLLCCTLLRPLLLLLLLKLLFCFLLLLLLLLLCCKHYLLVHPCYECPACHNFCVAVINDIPCRRALAATQALCACAYGNYMHARDNRTAAIVAGYTVTLGLRVHVCCYACKQQGLWVRQYS